MQKLHFEIYINASRAKVWDTMLSDETYRAWTQPFNPGSYFKGDWSEGSKMYFLGPDKEHGGEGGMVSVIAQQHPHEFLSIKHLGMVSNGVEDLTSDEVKKWAPSFENYTLTNKENGTLLCIDIDIPDEYKDFFEDTWPQSLALLKALSEK